MTRSVWLKADDRVGDWERRKRRITAGLEAGVDWVLVDRQDVSRVRELGAVNVAAFDGENDEGMIDADAHDAEESPDALLVGKGGEGDGTVDFPPDLAGSADLSALRERDGAVDGAYVRVLDPEYERLAEAAAAEAEYTIVIGEDWTIIPLENLIARIGEETELVAGVESATEARTAFETLESGADAVLLDSDDPDTIRETVAAREEADRETLDLRWATVSSVEQVGSADRVCVDTGSLLNDEEGMLVGSMSRGLFFVHAETAESPYVAARPFRVNAGAVHAYVRGPDGGTKYLAELTSGEEVQVVDLEGNTREAIVGRAKIERRPMFRVEAEIAVASDFEDADASGSEGDGSEDGGATTTAPDRIETLLQNAETIKVATREGRKAVTDLEEGDEVLVYYEAGGRHFGEAIEESIIEQ
jgi:3-dehydroquinate synthase II